MTTSKYITRLVCSMIAEASDAKKYSTCLSSNGSNSEVDPVLGKEGNSGGPCGRYSIKWLLSEQVQL